MRRPATLSTFTTSLSRSWTRQLPAALIVAALSTSCADAGAPKLRPSAEPVAAAMQGAASLAGGPAGAPPIVTTPTVTTPTVTTPSIAPSPSIAPTPTTPVAPDPAVAPASPVPAPPAPLEIAAPALPATVGAISVKAELSNTHVLMPGDGKVSVVAELAAAVPDFPTAGPRLSLNLALVIDRSGSMRGDKMDETKEAARKLVEQLLPDDTLSIVSYSDDVRVDLPASKLSAAQREAAYDAIARMQPSGSTNLSGGLARGQEEVQRNLSKGQVNRVILMSDGLANRGVTDTDAIAQSAQRDAQQGISVTTIGVGTDYNEDLMTAVADKASGNYYFVAGATAIPGVLTTELGKMAATVAQDARVEFRLDDGIELAQVYGYTFTRMGDVVSVPLAELFAGQKRSMALQVAVPVLREGLLRVGELTVTYTDRYKGPITETRAVEVTVTRDPKLVEAGRNRSVDERLVEVQAAAVLNQAANLVKEGRHGDAQKLILENTENFRGKAAGMGGSGRIQAQIENLTRTGTVFESAAAPSAAPAAAAEAVKRVKAESFDLAR
ncbi:MAG: VWA domain-containing protein [Myxococcales bacterium]|nr:VWA domain-containing protein [Myxococcales bacterium]